MEREKYIKDALQRDTELSKEDYRAKCEEADRSTEAHDVQGKAPLSEALRHKRIQTNFYGSALNIALSQLAELSRIGDALSDIALLIYASMTPEQIEKYIALKSKDKGVTGNG